MLLAFTGFRASPPQFVVNEELIRRLPAETPAPVGLSAVISWAQDEKTWTVVDLESWTTRSRQAKMIMQSDGSSLVTGMTPIRETYSIELGSRTREVSALRIEHLRDPQLPSGGPG